MPLSAIQTIIDEHRSRFIKRPDSQTETYIHVDEIAAKVAKFYERARNIIDYQEEHLLRKGAIERALQQGLIFRGKENNIAEALIKKIIRAGHLPNDKIPERKIGEVQRIIDNLLILLKNIKKNPDLVAAERNNVSEWLVQITASAIEEKIDPPVRERLISELMFQDIRRRLVITGKELSQNDKDLQLFIAIQRTLLKADLNQINYRLLKFSYPNWNSLSENELRNIARDLPALKHNIALHLHHPLGPLFFKLCNHYNTVFYLLGDVIFESEHLIEDTNSLLEDAENLGQHIRQAYKERYRKAKRGLARIAILSVISIFFSKILFALAIEVPIDKYVTGQYSTANMVINIIAPPALMLIILAFIRLPSRKNWGLIMKAVRAVTDKDKSKNIILAVPKKKNILTRYAANSLYFMISVLIFYYTAKLLWLINFSIANTVVFIIFASLVAATGMKVRNRSKDLSLEKEKNSFVSFLFDVLIMPFVTVGKIILAGLAKFKPFVIVIDFIDLPFNVFIKFIETLRDFIRSKKEELY